ncbi:MAG: type III toxin-antitoxin system ToxN/AbiQ family toxin [Defluviitaleaceae bacterium]|nr:type III toxin-antitoxin system ToxN/AbiQ family toxin [Defluviitaleaceae bacterium]
MELYNICDNYISYLKKFDSNVLENYGKSRPYIGLVLQINSFNYYVPLSSPKPKHKNMRNYKDFHKIKGGEYGVINFNKMIPAKSSQLTKIIIENEKDPLYKDLLRDQYAEISKLEEVIHTKAKKLYELVTANENDLTPNDIKIKARCCNFALLEEKMELYK